MHNGKINKTRYDDLGKLMKQISFIVKKTWGKTFPKSNQL